ncbi:MAG TPA: lyase family protein [Thermomicrobiales bacterium]|nr:lyase family protein [Thermomicrobiales bacterium]
MDASENLRNETWQAIADAATAHLLMLREAAVLDDAIVGALLDPLDAVRRTEPPAVAEAPGLNALIAAFDERVAALSPAGAGGAATIGRGRFDIGAAAMRLVLRRRLLGLQTSLGAARRALLDLADAHVFTLMPAFAGSRPVQPTTLAHFLGGAIAPLGRTATRLHAAWAEINRSPLGAGALASTGLPIDREIASDLLGCEGPIANTFDAVAAVDLFPVAAAPAAESAATLRRWLTELLRWLRSEPGSLRLAEAWLGRRDAALPGWQPPERLERLVAFARQIEDNVDSAGRLARDGEYGPVGAAADAAYALAAEAVAQTATLCAEVVDLMTTDLEINRAYLANRSGRDHTTSGELTDFLMAEEAIDPAAARSIAQIVVRRALEQGLEGSAINPQMIDAAALLVIGREIGVEIERLGGFLAPRRFLERRVATGAPAPAATRDYLELERTRLLADDRWRADAAGQIDRAAAERARLMAEIAGANG